MNREKKGPRRALGPGFLAQDAQKGIRVALFNRHFPVLLRPTGLSSLFRMRLPLLAYPHQGRDTVVLFGLRERQL
jgi:hypothetical protein